MIKVKRGVKPYHQAEAGEVPSAPLLSVLPINAEDASPPFERLERTSNQIYGLKPLLLVVCIRKQNGCIRRSSEILSFLHPYLR